MKRLEVSGAVRPVYRSLGVKGLNSSSLLSVYWKSAADVHHGLKIFWDMIVARDKMCFQLFKPEMIFAQMEKCEREICWRWSNVHHVARVLHVSSPILHLRVAVITLKIGVAWEAIQNFRLAYHNLKNNLSRKTEKLTEKNLQTLQFTVPFWDSAAVSVRLCEV